MYDAYLDLANTHSPYNIFQSKKVLPNLIYQEILEHLKQRDGQNKLARKSGDSGKWNELKKLKN